MCPLCLGVAEWPSLMRHILKRKEQTVSQSHLQAFFTCSTLYLWLPRHIVWATEWVENVVNDLPCRFLRICFACVSSFLQSEILLYAWEICCSRKEHQFVGNMYWTLKVRTFKCRQDNKAIFRNRNLNTVQRFLMSTKRCQFASVTAPCSQKLHRF